MRNFLPKYIQVSFLKCHKGVKICYIREKLVEISCYLLYVKMLLKPFSNMDFILNLKQHRVTIKRLSNINN